MAMLAITGSGAAWKQHRAVRAGINLIVGARAKSSVAPNRNGSVVAIFGAEAERNSSFMMGTKEGADEIRRAMRSKSLNSTTEQFVELSGLYKDCGNITESDYETTGEFHEALEMRVRGKWIALPRIEPIYRHLKCLYSVSVFEKQGSHAGISTVKQKLLYITHNGLIPLVFGGDHSITNPLVKGRASSGNHSEFAILHFDAHMDIYEDYEGNPYSHASPFARILESSPKICTKLIQIGIRSTTHHQRVDQAQRYGVEVMDMRSLTTSSDTLNRINDILPPDYPVYLSVDLDAMDPGFVPGVNHFEPGGMTPRFVLDIIEGLSQTLEAITLVNDPKVGADVVELCPSKDLNGMTAMVGAKIAREIIAKVATQHGIKGFTI